MVEPVTPTPVVTDATTDAIQALVKIQPFLTELAELNREAVAEGSSLEEILRVVAKDRLGILK